MVFGQCIFLILYPFSETNTWEFLLLNACIALIAAIVWEGIENVYLYKWGWKFENRKDSRINSIFDVIFVCAGNVLANYIPYLTLNVIVIVEILFFSICYWQVVLKKEVRNLKEKKEIKEKISS